MKNQIRPLPLIVGFGLVVLCLLLLVGVFFADELFPETSPAQRGLLVAHEAGCFACHGPGDQDSSSNPTRAVSPAEFARVPTLPHERQSLEELRQWIEDGIPERRRNSERFLARRESHALRMPAYRKVLSAAEIDDLLAYVTLIQYRHSVAETPPASPGEALAREYACFTCHGELGQGGVRNPDSLKGYIPGFFGTDFRALTRNGNRDDLREWIRDGYSQFFHDQGFAGFQPGPFFMQRQAINMPAYREHLSDEQVESLVDYLLELMDAGPLDAATLLQRYPMAPEPSHSHDASAPPPAQ